MLKASWTAVASAVQHRFGMERKSFYPSKAPSPLHSAGAVQEAGRALWQFGVCSRFWHGVAVARHPLHRGPAPGDEELFAVGQLPVLRAAAGDVCWLLDRGYALRSSIELVGNRYSLGVRQRMAISRSVCSREDAEHRASLMISLDGLRGKELWLDGYNVLTVLESALAGGVVLLGRDGCYRDIAGIHRRYRKVRETVPVLEFLGNAIQSWGVTCCRWWLDKPVSNSGRLRALILETAEAAGWPMTVDLVFSPDHVLSHTEHPIATSDSIVLNRCKRWVNLSRWIIETHVPNARIVDLSLGLWEDREVRFPSP